MCYSAFVYPGLYINQEAAPAIKEFMIQLEKKINRSVINVMTEDVYHAEHVGGPLTQKWKIRKGSLQEVAPELCGER